MANIIVEKVVKGVASGIGLVSEGVHHHRERKKLEVDDGSRKADSQASSQASSQTPLLEEKETDEEQWQLDEAQDELLKTHSQPENEMPLKGRDQINPTKITDAFVRRHPPPSTPQTLPDGTQSRLSLPVVLPQRRPKDRTRGFIRAYAPDLAIKGIDQETFLDFIETFNQASLANPWLDAINMAGFATLALPPGISQAVQLAIMVAVKVVKDIQSRKRQNTFLDRINDEFFRQRGLYCLVLTWQPESSELHTSMDLTGTIAQRETPVHGIDKVKRSMKTGSAVGDVEFTECATLVFPHLDILAAQEGGDAESKKAKLKHYSAFAGTYFDRRAQAKYAAKHPDSSLARLGEPTPKFTSRYADPNHPASSGNIWSLVTGGHFNPPNLLELAAATRGGLGGGGRFGGGNSGLGQGRMGVGGLGGVFGARAGAIESIRQQRMGYGGGSVYQDPYHQAGYYDQQGYFHQGTNMPLPQENPYQYQGAYRSQNGMEIGGMGGPLDALVGAVLGTGIGGGTNVVKRIFKMNVLYLMVVNMPTQEELAAADHFSYMADEQQST
ncbi:hypothetical protein LTR10_015226 [Elasticomyces elasticus]|uniref:Uncharacterized protein n=1 Tax=Exophiala sideris TaxID=1016849 RepID=A0ABR0JF24_9EURO|nr:hypothetical protein LTR10_015226 [Elasticomyces elasticus]KAK5032701.1 hypothetical protein LTS07_004111 [Exophiala sideris]KAK5037119.1 hypothetical protein LTR13_004924 [Exophiala sideris]KAK5062225.1 hypothetical protein LTR69_004583 [Exophiala sideris]KAK5182277.1 hypothetical protein LTR44_005288 [Eurotiomycetes sp. CCFEE 6388]